MRAFGFACMRAAGFTALFAAASCTAPAKSAQLPQYVTPPADQPMTSLIDMAAPSMPTFDAPGFDAGLPALGISLQDASSSTSSGAAFAGRQIFLNEGARAGAAAIVAAAIIGPPTGLRAGNQIASYW